MAGSGVIDAMSYTNDAHGIIDRLADECRAELQLIPAWANSSRYLMKSGFAVTKASDTRGKILFLPKRDLAYDKPNPEARHVDVKVTALDKWFDVVVSKGEAGAPAAVFVSAGKLCIGRDASGAQLIIAADRELYKQALLFVTDEAMST